MTHPQVLCLGEILWDCLADQPTQSVEQVASWTRYPGGAPANVACALAKLGTFSGFIGCVGEDEAGEQLIDLLERVGVEGEGIQRHSAPTRQIEVLRSTTGERQFAGFGGRNTTEFADTHLQADLLPVELFAHADYLVMGTLGLAYPETRQAMEYALQLADRHYLKLVVDVNWRPMFWPDPDIAKPIIRDFIQEIDFLKLSREEAEWLFDTADPSAIADRHGDVEGVVITDGGQGCTYALSGQVGRVAAFPVAVVDTTGAGDSFVAGLLHQLLQQGIPALKDAEAAQQMIVYASAVGALTTTKPGAIAAQPTAAEVKAFLMQQGLGG
ncbi:carbohydrate kinase family protein [Thermocoleostomius sinensis]|uniref:Carbohydrate kinase n=1 Tax=Thermocoleostomius sinensis A174 TaxID=2016057 RepID=A0A9E8ZCL0_9CYAN|nr:carbohydrate kinase [Thermocoleostomius sinensis]WAL60789.1 carbohydrate kinase [Thermocoleostomius sinensis A174]